MNRRHFVKSTAATVGAAALSGVPLSRAKSAAPQDAKASNSAAATGSLRSKPNIVLIISDQQRAEQHFPDNWAQTYTPAMVQLQMNGLTFNKAYCPSAMCSPSRSSLLTGLYPAQHGVTQTLSEGCSQSAAEVVLDPTLPNLATVMQTAGYRCFFKGKWHMSKAAGEVAQPSDVGQYGFETWDPPDAGGDTALYNFGGGIADNDARFLDDALNFINTYNDDKPFLLVFSVVNPHDVLSYPNTYIDGGYSDGWLTGPITDLPPTVGEDLRTNYKPSAQEAYLISLAAGLGPIPTDQMKLDYINFYSNLIKRIDTQIGSVLDALRNRGFFDDTLIVRTSDHGEMGTAHGGLRQKSFNMYEEALRIPLVFSNPKLYTQAYETDQLMSLVDLLPTLATVAEVPDRNKYNFVGRDLSRVLLNPNASHEQDTLLFTYDDIRCGQCVNQIVPPPNRMHTIIESQYKFSRYYDGDGQVPSEFEMYDLIADPNELQNVANPGNPLYDQYTQQRERLAAKLSAEVNQRLQPLASPPVRYFGSLTTLDNGWYASSWFGSFYGTDFPWIYHSEHGWLFCSGTGAVQNDFWFYDLDLGWLYTNSIDYPLMYSYNASQWLYYERGTTDPRYFYDFGLRSWIAVNSSGNTVAHLGHPGHRPDWFHGENALPDRPVQRPDKIVLDRPLRDLLALGSPARQQSRTTVPA